MKTILLVLFLSSTCLAAPDKFTVTAYTKNDKGCTGITATGKDANYRNNICAADWTVFRPGTKILIEGVGVYTVEDKGGAIKGNRIDILVNTRREAMNFGKQELKVRRVK